METLLSGLQTLVQFIPVLIGALVILLIGYIVGKLLQKGVAKLLQKSGVDRRMQDTQVGGWLERGGSGLTVSRLTGRVVFWLVFIFSLVTAIGALGIASVTTFMNQVLAYLPNVIAAIAIVVVAGLVAGAVGGLARRTMGQTPTGRVVAAAGPALVMGIAVFMVLTQLGIAPEIVMITYTGMIGALALGLALAFGLGGREIAAEMLRTGYRKAQRDQQVEAERERTAAPSGDTGWSTTTPASTQADKPKPAATTDL
ncbi:Conserved TM helix [Saccharopolyspora antimicrobica]|uniref:Conserved TM helix n=1 Tax=Saccharopolyspora antimicrobica TaxID=455193 RepID=A0A1I5EIA5_9PSEU|nr:transporter [Saccharopolyspora antimicrobica]RKT86830.1 putative transporter (transmembrane protein) [Saccharopolyspora antimicrobica]SFO11215.1 Conserved TM helix [Saccharopolyspora antimicrobica]